jgi:hypothetical protein
MEKAYWANRDVLMGECLPFQRPMSYWEFEIKISYPNCKINNYESERAALLRLQLPLTPQEQALLRAEQKPKTETSEARETDSVTCELNKLMKDVERML